MRAITKGPEPASLTSHRQTPHCDYGNYEGKDELRQTLVAEQRGLCCYCMRRIHNGPTTMKVEHWQCQAHYPAKQLNYRNLLGACLGGDGQPRQFQHCDTRKADRDLQWNPADPTHHVETHFRYEVDGTILADDVDFNSQLNDVLNLNLPVIKNNRKGVLTAVLEWWKAERPSRSRIQREVDERIGSTGHLEPYCQIAVWWLRQRLTRMAF